MFVEYHVPHGAAPGWYSGTVHVTGGVTVDVPVKLYVHAFTLPSTSSLPSAFGIGWNDACTAHYGGYAQCGGDPGVAGAQQPLHPLRARPPHLALRGRVQRPQPNSDGSYDWASWDAVYGPMLDGGMGGALVGAKLTSVRYMWTERPGALRRVGQALSRQGLVRSHVRLQLRRAAERLLLVEHQHAHHDGARRRPRLQDAGDDAARPGHDERRACPASTCWCRR